MTVANKFDIYSKYLKRNIRYNFLENKDSDTYIYFFDGQNLFDPEDAYMDATFEMAEALEKTGIAANVVGIFASLDGNRTNEYSPFSKGDPEVFYSSKQIPYEPLGIKTGEFIISELIPHIEKENPAKIRLIGGASMGGLMSLYMGATYPESFARVLAMSSHFNVDIIESGEFLAKYDSKYQQKIYIDVGGNEYADDRVLSQSYIDLNKMVYGFLKDKIESKFVFDKDGIHHESDWAARLPEALSFLLK